MHAFGKLQAGNKLFAYLRKQIQSLPPPTTFLAARYSPFGVFDGIDLLQSNAVVFCEAGRGLGGIALRVKGNLFGRPGDLFFIGPLHFRQTGPQ